MRYTISIPTKDNDLIELMEEQKKKGNLSHYIRNILVKELSNSSCCTCSNHEELYQILKKRLIDEGITTPNNTQQQGNSLDESDKDLIDSLF